MNCPICHENVYSGIGNGCKLCGMVLKDPSRDFCSKPCRKKFNVSRGINILTSFFIILIFLNPVLAHSGEDSFGHHSMMNFSMGFGGMGMFLWLIVFLVIIVLLLLIFWLVREISKK